MKPVILASAVLGVLALAAPAFSQAPTEPSQPQAQQSTPPQSQASGMCGCCKQMMTKVQPGTSGQPDAMPMPMNPAQPRG